MVQLLKWLDRRGRVAAVPFQKAGLLESVGLTRAEVEREAWAIEPDGLRHHGGAAVVAALSRALALPPLLDFYYLPGVRQTGDAVYAWVAENRSRFPGVTPHCQQHPADCDQS